MQAGCANIMKGALMSSDEGRGVRIAVVSLRAEDVAETAHFYRDVVGLKLAAHHGGRPHFEVGGAYLVIVPGRPRPAEANEAARFPEIALAVAGFQASVDRLTAAHVSMPWGIEGDSASKWVMFHDPAGNLVELVDAGPGVKPER
jgi:catechol 2,3-dioxygenase-like lactoylglutathione lyase family enzyme